MKNLHTQVFYDTCREAQSLLGNWSSCS